MLCVAKNNNEYVEVTPVKVVQDNSLLNVIKGINSYGTSNYPFELTADMWDENSTEISQYKFYFNKNITKVEIPNNIKIINAYAFRTCSNLISITIGNGVKSIKDGAFYGCSRLQIVDFRGVTQVPTIQSNSFYNVPTTCKIIIPDSLYDSWIASTNWVSLYNNGYPFIKASEYTEA